MLYSSDSLLASFIPCPKLMTSLFFFDRSPPRFPLLIASLSRRPPHHSHHSSVSAQASRSYPHSSRLRSFTPQRPVRAAACLRSHLHASRSPSPTWESCLPASAGLSAVQSRPLLCHRKSTNRWCATFPPVKCKCYKVHYHAGRVSLQIRKNRSFFSHICLYIHTSTRMHAFMHLFLYFRLLNTQHPPWKLSK